MPNRKQIIIFSVLGLTALLIGYFKNPLNLSMGKRAEVLGPIAPIAKPKPNPVKARAISQKDVVGTYEFKRDTTTFRYVLLGNGIRESYFNGKKLGDKKWSIVLGKLLYIEHTQATLIFRMNPDNSITNIADIRNGKRTDYPKEKQLTTYKKIN